MIEIFRNTQPEVNLDLYDLVSDAAPSASVTLGGQTIDLDVEAGVSDHSRVERWTTTIPHELTDEDREITVVWAGTSDSNPWTRSVVYSVVTPYVYPEYFADRLGWDLENSAAPNYRSVEEVKTAERMARFMIERITSQFFGKRYITNVSYGSGNDVLQCWNHIVELHKVWENGATIWNPNTGERYYGYDYEVTETGQAIRPALAGTDLDEYGRHYVAFGSAGAFKNGYRYDVEGYFGYESVPADITEAAIILSNDFLCRDRVWREKYVEQAAVEEWKLRFHELAFRGTGNLTADRLLSAYSQPIVMVI